MCCSRSPLAPPVLGICLDDYRRERKRKLKCGPVSIPSGYHELWCEPRRCGVNYAMRAPVSAGFQKLNDRDISFRHLKVLSLLLEVQSLTRAAEILNSNQPTVSKILAKLRAHFDDPLFVRVGLAMHPTPKALEIVEPLRALLEVSESLRASSSKFAPDSSNREFKVLVTEGGMIRLLPPLMHDFERAGRGLRLKALPFDSREFAAKLETGEADVALGGVPGGIGQPEASETVFGQLCQCRSQGPSTAG